MGLFRRKKTLTQLDVEIRLEKLRAELEALRAEARSMSAENDEPRMRPRKLAAIRAAVRKQPIAYSGLTMATGALFGALLLRR